ncbi:hypothetical protein CVT26_006741 [Gymnopilus dilepis]|uniref:Uncharacterized protein n=1 Tax=Gymnopilus dilepis TaxID=231916 RepID=A0A409W0L5_9AGAR|nr:hypothetical protein CVT26_006741 [Gymnopilus dilepis]
MYIQTLAFEVTSPFKSVNAQSTNNHLATASLVANGQDPSSSQGAKTAVGREAPSIMDCHCKSKHPEEWKIINELTGTGLQMLEVTITAKQPNN